MKKMQKWLAGLVAVVVAMASSSVHAATQDWTSVSTAVTAEIGAVMPIALTIFGAVIAVLIGKKIFKSVAK